mmetsp:Transcript_29673/g.48490  ORF Transcript_29673/g.48490 Transcript_29673/m.48490 type:complete len:155 (+) Transcript_29673:17-481(+)
MARPSKRLQKERARFEDDSMGMTLDVQNDGTWIVGITGAPDTLYAGEFYQLRVKFESDYPLQSPEVVFLEPAPEHPFIYSNGFICFTGMKDEHGRYIYDDWTPSLTVHQVCLSLLSMLSAATEKSRPEDNDALVQHWQEARASPKNYGYMHFQP